MLSREQSFFLSVLADHLNGRETAPVAELDWKVVHGLASRHCLSALFYAQCGAFLPPRAELRFLQDYATTVADYAARQKMAADIDRAFTRLKLPFVIVKGLAVAESYPQPELRTMGDLDIVVKAEDKEKAHRGLLELGFENGLRGTNEWVYWQGRYEVELHHRLLYDSSLIFGSSLQLTDQIWEHVRPLSGSSRCELENEFHFLCLATHLQKHLALYGAGFRQFMDLAVAAQQWPMDWDKLNGYLEEMDSRTFVELALTLCNRWFQLTLPHADSDISPDFEQDFCQQLFSNGIYGFDNEANKNHSLVNKINAAGNDTFMTRLRLLGSELTCLFFTPPGFWRTLFPSYNHLRRDSAYRFLNHRPWLLPAAWLHRFYHRLWAKVTRICTILMFSRERIQERNDTLKKMGMLRQGGM